MRGRHRADVGQKLRAHPVEALLREIAVDVFDVRDAGLAVVGVGLPPVGVEFSVGAATQFRCRVPDPAWVEADQVEPATDLCVCERDAHACDGVDRGGSRPARVHHQAPRDGHRWPVSGSPPIAPVRLRDWRSRREPQHRAALRRRDGAGVADELVDSQPRPAPDRRSGSPRPSGVADAAGHATPAASTHASSVAPPRPTRHMAVIVARRSRAQRSRNRTVTVRRPWRAQESRFVDQQRVSGGGTFTSMR